MSRQHGGAQRQVRELVAQLAASETRLRSLIERSPDAFVIVDGAGVVQFVNPAAVALFGVKDSQLVGRPFGLPVTAGHTTDVDIVSRHGEVLVAEMRVVETEWNGKKAHVAVLRDITERSRAAQSMRENEKRLTLAMDVAGLDFWDIDLPTGRVIGDEKLVARLGYGRSDVEPWREAWGRLVHPDDEPRARQAFEDHLQGKTPTFRTEFRLRAKSGEWRWVLFQGEVVERHPDGVAQRVIGVTEDITERKHVAQDLEATQAKLRLAAAVARLGFWEWDPQTNAVYFSSEWKKQLGYAEDELPERFEEFVSRLHPLDRERTLTEQLRLAGIQRSGLELEYRLRHKDGTYRWIASRLVHIRGEAGQLVTLMGTHLDITERKEVEERIRVMSQHDPLTGLPNRALLYEFADHLLAAAHRDGTRAAFLFVDLDRFKPINDTYGHDVGDAVLKAVAKRLTECVRDGDLVARLGGDEFLAVLSQIKNGEDAAKAARHVLDRLGRPYHLNGSS
jgi:PAS domain S-box-containing protein